MPDNTADLVIEPTAAERAADEHVSEVDALIKEIEGDWEEMLLQDMPEDGAEAPEADAAEGTIAATDPARVEKPAADAAADPSKPSEDPAVERGLERLIAREREVAEREARARDSERETVQLRAQLEELRSAAVDVGALRQMASTDPGRLFETLGVDADYAVKLHLARKMGDKAPPELRQAIREADYQRRLDELDRRLAADQAARDNAAYFQRVSDEARAYVTKGLSAKDAPTVAEEVAADPAGVHNDLLEVIATDARDRLSRGERRDAPLMSHAEAVKVLEARYAAARKRWSRTPAAAPAGGTASTTAAGTKAGAAPVKAQPGTKPILPKSIGTDEVLNAGLQAGLAEFRRSEQERRAARKTP